MFEHTSNSLLFMGAAFVAILFWLDSRTGKPPHHAYAGGHNPAPRPPEPSVASSATPSQAAPQPRPTQAPTVAATAQPQAQERPAGPATP
jgi:hypothetical protein